MTEHLIVDYERIQSGQARAYGPTERKYRITFTREGEGGWGWTPPKDMVKKHFEALLSGPVHEKDDDWEWWMECYKEFREEAKGVWFIHTYQEYLD